MSVVAILKTCLSLFTDYSFTVYRRMEDGGWRMEDGGWGRRQLRMKTSTGTFTWKKMSMKQSVQPQLNLYKK